MLALLCYASFVDYDNLICIAYCQWLRDWTDRLNNAGAVSAVDALMGHLAPEEADVELCRTWTQSAIK